MGRKTRVSKMKTMNPNFFVFCEGKSEIAYIKFLRSVYRVPIQIIPRKSDSNISEKYMNNCKREYVTTSNDRTFLMFDLDVENILERLQKFSDTTLLVSNPCIELWFLLHYEDSYAELSSDACIKKLKNKSAAYIKGYLQPHEKEILSKNVIQAVKRAKSLKQYKNPSTTVYKLIEELNKIQATHNQ
ncbi:MAG: RloB family protein [Oscillibacter sp.]|nr:RloB family protein [Oscillibacter sp.]